MEKLAQIGIFGGSGFYSFCKDNAQTIEIDTPYGKPSDKITIAEIEGKKVAFMPRHGSGHSVPPSKINYRANVWAMKNIGCEVVISPCAAGSLQKHIKPGDIVFCDQYVDRTNGRADTFYEGPKVVHVTMANPYCDELRKVAVESAKNLGLSYHDGGAIVVINGPRFSTTAESKFYTEQGWDVINMTQYPEAYLVRELNMCPLNISLITDYDAGIVAGCEPVSHEAVLKVFQSNIANLQKLLIEIVKNIDTKKACECKNTVSE